MAVTIADLAYRFASSACFSVLFGALVYAAWLVAAARSPRLRQWRAFWAAGILFCVLMTIWTLIPVYLFDRSVHQDLVGVIADLGTLERPASVSGLVPEHAPSPVDLWPSVILGVYMAGLVFCLARIAFARRLLSRVIAASEALPSDVRRDAERWIDAAQAGGERRVRPELRLSRAHVSPFAVAGSRPMIVLTPFSLARLSSGELELIVLHELAHVRSRDSLVRNVAEIVQAVFWFNPFVRLLALELELAAELECDAAILRRDAGKRRLYSDAFMKIAREMILSGRPSLASASAFFKKRAKRVIAARIRNLRRPGIALPTLLDKAALAGLGVVSLAVGIAGKPVFSAEQPRVELDFIPITAAHGYAARMYEAIWEEHGERIIAALEARTCMPFSERHVAAVVADATSHSGGPNHPMRLRASYPRALKQSTLVHELGHRHLWQLVERMDYLDGHKTLYLILDRVWADVWGEEFAAAQIASESAWQADYDYAAAWSWVRSLAPVERARLWNRLRWMNGFSGECTGPLDDPGVTYATRR